MTEKWIIQVRLGRLGYRMRLIEHAFLEKKPDIVNYLIKVGVDLYFPGFYPGFFHEATASNWIDTVELLLGQPNAVPIDLKIYPSRTALQLAVSKGFEKMTALLLRHKANPKVIDREKRTLLHISCQKGYVGITKLLIDAGLDINAKYHKQVIFWSYNKSPLLAAFDNKNHQTRDQIIKVLLQHNAVIDPLVLRVAIEKGVAADVFAEILKRCKDEFLCEGKALHLAVEFKRIDIIKQLLTRAASLLINNRDNKGRTPLHISMRHGDKALYSLLVAHGADDKMLDYSGDSVMRYGIYYGNIAFSEEFKKLRLHLINYKEFNQDSIIPQDKEFILGIYCYKLIRLFVTAKRVLAYIKKHQDVHSRQPIHDLCLFRLPNDDKYDLTLWAKLAEGHGNELTKYLHLAASIERLLGHAPSDLNEVISAAEKIKYNRETENVELAALFSKYQIPEEAFNRVLDEYIPKMKVRDKLPPLFIEIDSRYYLKKLACNDYRGFILGAMTHCCQSVGSAGEVCAVHGMTSPYGGFYAVFKKPRKNIKELFAAANKATTFLDFINGLAIKSQRRKYMGIMKRGITLAALRQQLQREAEGELIAQSWAWISAEGNLVFDSWERKRDVDDILCKKFLIKAAEQFVQGKVLIGTGGQTPDDLGFIKADHPERPYDYMDYRDSHAQLLVAAAQKKAAATIASTLFVQPKKGYNREQVETLLKYYINQDNITILPIKKAESFIPIKDPQNKHIFLHPLYEEDGNWVCYIFICYPQDKMETIYIDLTGRNRIPLMGKNIVRSRIQYIDNPADSAPYLIEVLRNFIDKGRIVIPLITDIDKIVASHEQLISTHTQSL